jgi:RNA polymerase sigma-70 factor (ECF subfamily)
VFDDALQDPDDDLMRRFCGGDERAFEALYARHADRLYAFLKRMVGQRELAEDLLQATFLSVVRSRGRYEPGTKVVPWLFAIAANAARDSLRKRRVRADASAALAEHVDKVSAPSEPDPPAALALQAALAELPDDQREAVLLHKMHELSFAEIAEALGITVSAAKVRAHRGYEKLRHRLAALAEDA